MSESGFIFQIISTLVQGMALFTEGICLEKLLTGRDDRGSKKIRILNWFVWGFIFVVIKCMFIAPPVYYCVLYPVLLSITHAFVLIYFYRDRIWLRFTHGAMLLLQNILSEFILYVCFGQVKNLNFLRPDFGNPYLAERSAMIAVLSIFMNSIYTVFVLKIQKKKAIAVGSIWIAVMLQVLCAFTVLGALRWSTSEAINYNIYITYMSGAVGLEFSISLLFFSQSEKREIKENVRKLQQEAELKKAHYEQVEIHRQELEKLRSDYGTILINTSFFCAICSSNSTCSPSITIVLIPSFSTLTCSRTKSSLKINTESFLSVVIVEVELTVKSAFFSSSDFTSSPIQ